MGYPGAPNGEPLPDDWRRLLEPILDDLVQGRVDQLVDAGLLIDRGMVDILFYDEPDTTLVKVPEEGWVKAHRVPPESVDVWTAAVPMWTAERGETDVLLHALVDASGPSIIEVDFLY